MADHDDMVLRIELLMGPHRNIAHGNVLASFETGLGQLPGFAHVEKRELFSMLEHGFHLPGADFEIHRDASSFWLLAPNFYPLGGWLARRQEPAARSFQYPKSVCAAYACC